MADHKLGARLAIQVGRSLGTVPVKGKDSEAAPGSMFKTVQNYNSCSLHRLAPLRAAAKWLLQEPTQSN